MAQSDGLVPIAESRDIWHGQTVLVTGARGFLGNWLIDKLADAGASVVALSHETASSWRAGVVVETADIRDASAVTDIFARHPIGTVFHLAAKTFPALARHEPAATFEVNTRGSWNILEAARTAPSNPAIVFSSTDSVYGENDGASFVEDAPLAPAFPYETSKACAEMIARSYSQTYGMRVAIARFCNIYGPGDLNSGRLIAGTVAAAVSGTRQVMRGDGRAVRNYLYVDDAASALMQFATALDKSGGAVEALNFCDEKPYSVAEIVDRILQLAGRPDLQPQFGIAAEGEISVKRASAEMARRRLGWQPRVSLEDGLRQTIAWHRARVSQIATDHAPSDESGERNRGVIAKSRSRA